MKIELLQAINNILYKIFGAKDFVIDFQVKINTMRYEQNKPDKNEIIVEEEDGSVFVQ